MSSSLYELMKHIQSNQLIDPLGLTSKNIETLFQNIALHTTNLPKEDWVENQLRNFPSMVLMFYAFVYAYRKLPDQYEFLDYYYRMNAQWVLKTIPDPMQAAFVGRLSRFYPSMLRDFHFYHLCKEDIRFDNVEYSLYLDLDVKYDLLITHEKKKYGIMLRTLTKNATFYLQEEKMHKKRQVVDAMPIDMPISLSTAKNVQTRHETLKLYHQGHIDELIEKMQINNECRGVV